MRKNFQKGVPVVMPVHRKDHWACALIFECESVPHIYYLDSLLRPLPEIVKTL